MAPVDARVAEWVEIVADLLSQPLTIFPAERISAHMLHSFDADAVTYNWRDADGTAGVEGASLDGRRFGGMDFEGALAFAHRAMHLEGLLDHHPLVRWFAATGEPSAQTMGRVPPAISRTDRQPEILEVIRFMDLPVQMSIPVTLDGVAHKAFVPVRSAREDFSAEDVVVARRIQVMLAALNRQCDVLAAYTPPPPPPPNGLLTCRELAVLQLIARGATAIAAGHQLGCSPRTVQKHTESIYRKLHVRDRVSAVRVAGAMGLLPPVRTVA
jgi:DNA-binding CsgD family transcriptional regulator